MEEQVERLMVYVFFSIRSRSVYSLHPNPAIDHVMVRSTTLNLLISSDSAAHRCQILSIRLQMEKGGFFCRQVNVLSISLNAFVKGPTVKVKCYHGTV